MKGKEFLLDLLWLFNWSDLLPETCFSSSVFCTVIRNLVVVLSQTKLGTLWDVFICLSNRGIVLSMHCNSLSLGSVTWNNACRWRGEPVKRDNETCGWLSKASKWDNAFYRGDLRFCWVCMNPRLVLVYSQSWIYCTRGYGTHTAVSLQNLTPYNPLWWIGLLLLLATLLVKGPF